MARVARNAEYTKEYNRKLILRLLRYQPMSRAEIARQTGLTRACTSLIATELLNDGLVRELEPITGKHGRMPIPLALCGAAGYAVGVYLNRDGCTAGIVDMEGTVHVRQRIRIEKETEKFDAILQAIREMREQTGFPEEKYCGIGISAPGLLDGESGRILNPPRFDLWQQTDIGPALSEGTGLPVFLENNATCLAGYHYGRPESGGSSQFLLLLVDSGVGSGVISKGKVLKGAGYFNSELGHTSIDYRGRRCECGNIGCLECYAAIPKLLQGSGFRSWRQLIDAYPESEEAQELLHQEAEYLSTGVINLTNLVSVDTVLLAGDLLYGVELIAPLMEELINARILHGHVSVLPSMQTPDIKILAAADAAFRRSLIV